MLQRTQLTPRQEDDLLFSQPLGQCQVDLIPKYRTNRNNELVIHGFLNRDSDVEVLFSGRRKAFAEPLIHRLQMMWEKAQARGADETPARPEDVRLPIAVYGSWRSRFSRDSDGWQTKRIQLIAAIWRVHDSAGRPITRGSAPMLQRDRQRVAI